MGRWVAAAMPPPSGAGKGKGKGKGKAGAGKGKALAQSEDHSFDEVVSEHSKNLEELRERQKVMERNIVICV